MRKSNVLVASTLLAVLVGLAGCDGNGETSNSNSVEGSSSSIVDSSSSIISDSSSDNGPSPIVTVPETNVPTASLSIEMLQEAQKGYAVRFVKATSYDGNAGSGTYFDARVNEKNYAFERHSVSNDGNNNYFLGNKVETSQYQINPNEEEEWTYNAGLSIGNTIIYTPVMGRDKYTFQEIEMTWEEAGYSNFFMDLSITDFERVGNDNVWSLKVENLSGSTLHKIAMQLFGEDVSSDIEHFHLLTNGDKIVGYDLVWETYLQYENYASKSSSGIFYDLGEDVVDFKAPLENRAKDKEFDDAIAKLQNYNYKVNHSQAGFDYTSERMVSRGHFEAECDNNTLNYDYYTAAGKKYMNYAYYNVVEDGVTYLQGATKIKDNFYPDVAYYGSLSDILPSFNISSEMFIKSNESTEDVLVYNLDKSVIISLDNDNATYSSFDSDGYSDRTVYLTVTIDKVNNTVNFHNETTASSDSGLVEDVFYSEIGEVETIRTEVNTKTNADDLTWEDLFSNDESALESFKSKFPAEVLESLPTFGGRYAYVNYDPSGIIFVTTYDKAENEELMTGYGEKLEIVGFELGSTTIDGNTYPTYYTTFTQNKRTYGLTLTLMTYWNANLEWGQFQVHVTIGAAKP